MKYTMPDETDHLSLAEVIARLSRRARVKGLLQIGSLATGALTEASDYDLVIVLGADPGASEMQPWYVGVTQIDHRLTDLIFVAMSQVARLSALSGPVAPGDPLAPVIQWFQRGTIVHDRDHLLRRAKEHLAAESWLEPADDQAAHATWFSVNYNLIQTRRIAQADNALYQKTAEIRMAVYGHTDLWHGYFTLRRLPWDGDKAAIVYLLEHDPEFLEAYREFVAESSVEAKLSAYERVAALVTSVRGGLWPAGATAMNVDHALETWQALLHTDG